MVLGVPKETEIVIIPFQMFLTARPSKAPSNYENRREYSEHFPEAGGDLKRIYQS